LSPQARLLRLGKPFCSEGCPAEARWAKAGSCKYGWRVFTTG